MREETLEFLDEIDEMLLHEEKLYEFARTTLEGIRFTVYATDHITAPQRAAINNIRNSRLPGHGEAPGWKRRYEGFYRGKEK